MTVSIHCAPEAIKGQRTKLVSETSQKAGFCYVRHTMICYHVDDLPHLSLFVSVQGFQVFVSLKATHRIR